MTLLPFCKLVLQSSTLEELGPRQQIRIHVFHSGDLLVVHGHNYGRKRFFLFATLTRLIVTKVPAFWHLQHFAAQISKRYPGYPWINHDKSRESFWEAQLCLATWGYVSHGHWADGRSRLPRDWAWIGCVLSPPFRRILIMFQTCFMVSI